MRFRGLVIFSTKMKCLDRFLKQERRLQNQGGIQNAGKKDEENRKRLFGGQSALSAALVYFDQESCRNGTEGVNRQPP